MATIQLEVDPERRLADGAPGTGIYVRARDPEGHWDAFDICELTRPSLIEWLRSRGGNNPWAEEVVLILLGHPRSP